jgi:hypothetical protein
VAFHNYLRGTIASDPATIYKESFSATTIKGIRVKSAFTVLAGADADNILSWQESIRVSYDQPQYEPITFPGAAPVLVQKPQTFGQITQSGHATGNGVYIKPDDPLNNYLLKLPEIDYEQVDEIVTRTSWTYVMAGSDPTDGTPNVYPLAPVLAKWVSEETVANSDGT